MASISSKAKLAKADFKAACKYIDSGVAIEENGGDRMEAIALYKRGATLLAEALSRPNIKNDTDADVVSVRRQMEKFRNLCSERIAILSRENGSVIKPTVTPTLNQTPREPSASEPIEPFPRSLKGLKSTALLKLKKFDQTIVTKILDDLLEDCSKVTFDDIAGNEGPKEHLRETVIYPTLRPDLFTGLREPVRGILLFGPPGNGKTLLAKAVATESKCVFLNISAASILSKWVGESERYVKTLFAVARALSPTIIFLDEVDALLVSRGDASGAGSGSQVGVRVLTQFLAELDGAGSGSERILVLGATNRPQELDEAALRRFPKRLLIPLPDQTARVQLLTNLLKKQPSNGLSHADILCIARTTTNYSASDLTQLAKDAALGPIRSLRPGELTSIRQSEVRPLSLNDFKRSLTRVRPSLTSESLNAFVEWNRRFGDVYDADETTTTSSITTRKLPSIFTS